MGQYSCEFCSNYVYDEEYEEYGCVVSMDEDDYARQLQNPTASCPYFMVMNTELQESNKVIYDRK